MKKTAQKIVMLGTIIITIVACKSPTTSEYEKMVEFAQGYTDAWNSKNPENMAAFYTSHGTLTVNNGTPAIGTKQLAETAKSYMDAFPDLTLTMDSLVANSGTYKYYWTFTGTNTGTGGTGNTVHFSGFEKWTMSNEGLIQESIGSYDADDYNRQLNKLKAE